MKKKRFTEEQITFALRQAESLAECMKNLLQDLKKRALREGFGEVPSLVWPNENWRGPILPGNFRRRVFYKVLEKTGIRRMRPHDAFRHTFASLLLQNGESLVYVKEQCGHSSIRITVDVYGHLMESRNPRAAQGLDAGYLDAGVRRPEDEGAMGDSSSPGDAYILLTSDIERKSGGRGN